MESTAVSPLRRVSAPVLEAQIQKKLEALFPEGESQRWLDTAQPQFGGSPRELLAGGQGARVLRILTRLEQGVPT